jgi:hypothetical protein
MFIENAERCAQWFFHCLRISMLCSPAQQPLYTLYEDVSPYFVLQQVFIPYPFLSFFLPLSYALFHIFYLSRTAFRDSVFTKAVDLHNQNGLLLPILLMPSVHCGLAAFPYKALESRDFNRLCGAAS